jgi:hypothetical protein
MWDSAQTPIAAAWWRVAVCLAAGLLAVPAHAADTIAGSAAALVAKYGEVRGQLSDNQFRKPVYLVSGESPDSVAGDMYALVDQPFAVTAAALQGAGDWCEIMILHLNTKYCRASTNARGSVLNVSIGKKHDQPVEDAYRVAFAYRVAAQTPDYLQVRLHADRGPFSTRDYNIVLEAVPVDRGRTFLHFSYSYGFGTAGKLAMQVYLGTAGSGKVGFTIAGTQADGKPRHIGGMRGVVERNTMRYYLAVEAFLGSLSAPPQQRVEKRLRDWFAATERYPRQLHELERDEYLEMKRREYQRQQAHLPPSKLPGEVAHVQAAGTG